MSWDYDIDMVMVTYPGGVQLPADARVVFPDGAVASCERAHFTHFCTLPEPEMVGMLRYPGVMISRVINTPGESRLRALVGQGTSDPSALRCGPPTTFAHTPDSLRPHAFVRCRFTRKEDACTGQCMCPSTHVAATCEYRDIGGMTRRVASRWVTSKDVMLLLNDWFTRQTLSCMLGSRRPMPPPTPLSTTVGHITDSALQRVSPIEDPVSVRTIAHEILDPR